MTNTNPFQQADEYDIKILNRWKNGDKMIREDLWHVINKIPTCYGAWVYAQAHTITIKAETTYYSQINHQHHATTMTTTPNRNARLGAGSHKEELIAKWFAFRNSIRHQMTRSNN